MKTTGDNELCHGCAGGANWNLLITVAAVAIFGWIAMHVGGFEFAPDAANLFLTKLPVLFLVALLVERTGEIFLTIWRGADAVKMQAMSDSLVALKEDKVKRDARLAELPTLITACGDAISKLKDSGKDAELKVQQDQKLALEKERAELDVLKMKEDGEIAALEAADLTNGKKGTVDNRTYELADYKNQTRNVALTFNFCIALLVAAGGFRAMEGLVILRPVDSTVQSASPTLAPALLKAVTQDLTAQIQRDQESLGKTADAGARDFIKRQQDVAWAGWIEKQFKDNVVTRKTDQPTPNLAAAPGNKLSKLDREKMAFRFLDILLTGGLLAGGADPISRIMKLLRDFLDQGNKRVNVPTK